MPSSPAEARRLDDVLRALAQAYDEALAAAAADDLAACGRLLEAADALLASPLAPAADPDQLDLLRADARAAHARLCALIAELQSDAGAELGRTRHGRKALQGYAGERTLGDRIETRV